MVPHMPKDPIVRRARSRPRHLLNSGWAERLWSKDQAASPLRHRRSVGRLSAKKAVRLKLVSILSPLRSIVVVDRTLDDAYLEGSDSLRN